MKSPLRIRTRPTAITCAVVVFLLVSLSIVWRSRQTRRPLPPRTIDLAHEITAVMPEVFVLSDREDGVSGNGFYVATRKVARERLRVLPPLPDGAAKWHGIVLCRHLGDGEEVPYATFVARPYSFSGDPDLIEKIFSHFRP